MKKIFALLLSVLIFSGCSGTANRNNIINLLSSPKLSRRESRIVTAISDYLQRDIVLKYPKRDTGISPVQIVDLSGKNSEEAVVLYSAPLIGGNVRIAVLVNENGGWKVISDDEGFGSEIYKINFSTLTQDGKKQIIVGYTFADSSEKLLSIYYFEDGSISDVQTVACQNFTVYDITGDGVDDIVLAGVNADNQQTRLKIYSTHYSDNLQVTAAENIGITNAKVTNITFGKEDYYGGLAVMLDYHDTYHRIYTQAFVLQENNLVSVLRRDVVQKIWNRPYHLNSIDVNSDGYIETPTIIDGSGYDSENLKFMEWTSFLKPVPERVYFGVCNVESGVYFPLPDSWQNYIKLSQTDEKTWQIVRIVDSLPLVTFSPVNSRQDAQEGENQVILGTGVVQIKITFDESVPFRQKKYICDGMLYLK